MLWFLAVYSINTKRSLLVVQQNLQQSAVFHISDTDLAVRLSFSWNQLSALCWSSVSMHQTAHACWLYYRPAGCQPVLVDFYLSFLHSFSLSPLPFLLLVSLQRVCLFSPQAFPGDLDVLQVTCSCRNLLGRIQLFSVSQRWSSHVSDCHNLQRFAVLACKQVLQAYAKKFTQIP